MRKCLIFNDLRGPGFRKALIVNDLGGIKKQEDRASLYSRQTNHMY